MEKDRSDLLDMSIGLLEAEFGVKVRSYEELYDQLDQYFGSLRFTMDEIVEFYSLQLAMEDQMLIMKNAGLNG